MLKLWTFNVNHFALIDYYFLHPVFFCFLYNCTAYYKLWNALNKNISFIFIRGDSILWAVINVKCSIPGVASQSNDGRLFGPASGKIRRHPKRKGPETDATTASQSLGANVRKPRRSYSSINAPCSPNLPTRWSCRLTSCKLATPTAASSCRLAPPPLPRYTPTG